MGLMENNINILYIYMVDNSTGPLIVYSPSTEATKTVRATFATDGHETFYPAWEDLRVPVVTANATVNGPTLAVLKAGFTIWVYKFINTGARNVTFVAQMPHNWKEGTDIIPHVHYIPDTGGVIGQTITWTLDYVWMNIGDTIPGAVTIVSSTYTTVAGDTEKHIMQNIPSASGISGTGKTMSSCLICRLWRDTSSVNTWATNISFLEVDFHYQVDSLGSLTTTTK
jgi:hypothetical protein